jgi:hypothetical protein
MAIEIMIFAAVKAPEVMLLSRIPQLLYPAAISDARPRRSAGTVCCKELSAEIPLQRV